MQRYIASFKTYNSFSKDVALKKVIEQNEESIEKKIDEIEDYETLFDILKSHLQFDKFGITIELKSYIEKDKDDLEILTVFCISERVSVSAVLNALVTDFLDTTDTEYRKKITNEALKIKQGRPKVGD